MIKVSQKQNFWGVISALLVLVFAALVALYFSGKLNSSLWRFSEKPKYQNVTFTDAVLKCKSMAKQHYAEELANLVVDNHSSRYDNKQFLYKIFLELDVKKEPDEPPVLFYVNCFVKASNGRIDEFESFEFSGEGGAKGNGGTNMFGFPIK